MRIGREDFTGEELFTPPWRRRSNLLLALGCALIASLVAGPIVRDFFPASAVVPPEPKQVHDIAAEWDIAVPEGIGEAVYSQVAPGHVLVAGKRGFAVLDSATGDELWGQGYGWDDPEWEMSAEAARRSLRVVGDALLMNISPEPGIDTAKPARVVELHSGEQRFATPKGKHAEFRVVATVESLVVETCDEDGECTLSGLSWKDGGRKWRYESEDEATLPIDLPQGVVEGQTDLTDFISDPLPVPSKSLAVVADFSPHDSIRYRAIDLAEGKRIREWDTTNDSDTAPEYTVAGSLLVERTDSVAAIIDPETGEEVYELYERGPGFDLDYLPQSFMDDTLLIDAYSKGTQDVEDGYDGFRIVDTDNGQVAMETDAAAGFLLGGELGTVVMLTGTGPNGRPKLHGVDVETGDKRWTTSLFPKGTEMNGFHSQAVAMFDNHLAVTGGPSSWTGGEFFGGARTHVVDLDSGKIRRIDDIQVQALGHNSMLGLRNPPIHEDETGEPRLAFYQL